MLSCELPWNVILKKITFRSTLPEPLMGGIKQQLVNLIWLNVLSTALTVSLHLLSCQA